MSRERTPAEDPARKLMATETRLAEIELEAAKVGSHALTGKVAQDVLIDLLTAKVDCLKAMAPPAAETPAS